MILTRHPLISTMLSLVISASPATILAETSSKAGCLPGSSSSHFQTPEWVKIRRAEMEAMREKYAADRNPRMPRQIPPHHAPEVPEWVSKRRAQLPMTHQNPQFEMRKAPDWVAKSRLQPQTTPQWMPTFEVPEWVAKRQAQHATMHHRPAFERPTHPIWTEMGRPAYMNAPTFERPELPEWVKDRRAQMQADPQMQRTHWQPGMMPQPHTAPVASQAGYHTNGTPTWAAPAPYYGHPYQNNGWGGSNWGPFDGMGDMFGNMDMDFSMSLRGSGSNHGYGRGYNGYGHGLNRWPATLTPVETASIEVSPVVEVAVTEQATVVDESPVKSDGDADGILDISDICPDSAAGAVVDDLGCEKSASIVLRGVNFKTNSDELTENSTEILDRVANTLIANPAVVVEIAGHTDSDADESYNKDLSQRRAETVMAYLTDKGATASNMTAMGYGEEQPIASNETSEGKAQNRRVELIRNK